MILLDFLFQKIEVQSLKPPEIGIIVRKELVEARGVEPLSENPSTQFSPSAVDYLHSLSISPVYEDICLSSFIYPACCKALASSFSALWRLHPSAECQGRRSQT